MRAFEEAERLCASSHPTGRRSGNHHREIRGSCKRSARIKECQQKWPYLASSSSVAGRRFSTLL